MSDISLDDLDALIRRRRTSMFVDLERPVPDDLVDRLCEMAMWAPNHKRTWPWRFAALTGASRGQLGEAFVADMIRADFGDDVKRTKTLTKFNRAPLIIVVGSAPPPKDGLLADDRDAVAAGIQNMLLGATAVGLESYWSTAPVTVPETVNDLCCFPAGTRIVGVLYLGWPNGIPQEVPQRPPVEVIRLS